MTEPTTEGGRTIGAFEFSPKLAAAFGIYMGELTSFELAVTALFAFTIRVHETIARPIVGHMMIGTRIAIIADCAGVSFHHPPVREQIKALATRATEINARRNEYVHGQYRTDTKTGHVLIETWPFAARRTSKTHEVKAEHFEAETIAVRTFIGELVAMINPDVLKRGLTIELPKPPAVPPVEE